MKEDKLIMKKLPDIEQLKKTPIAELRAQFAAYLGNAADSGNKVYVIKAILHNMQMEHCGLSHAAKAVIKDKIAQYDPINQHSTHSSGKASAGTRDKRLPIPGSLIVKKYKGKTYEVRVLEKGFEYNSTHYRTLTEIAREITGTHWNGFMFFGFRNANSHKSKDANRR